MDPSPLVLRAAAKLVEVDGADQHRPDGDLLPERLDADDDEPVLQHGRDEDAEDGPEHGPDAAEQARPADDDRRDRVEVVGVVAAERRRREARERHEPGQARQRARQRVDLHEVTVDADAGAPRRLLVGADRVRVAPEARPGQQDAEDERDGERDDHQVGHLVEQPPAADRRDELERHVALVDAAGDEQRRAERHPERAERDDQRRDARLGDEEAVQRAPRQAGRERTAQPGEDRAPVVAADHVHRLDGDDAAEYEHRADRQVDAGRDDHVRHPGRDDQEDGGVRGDVARVRSRDEARVLEHREGDDQRHEDEPDPRAGPGHEALPPRHAVGGGLLGEQLFVGRQRGRVRHAASSSWRSAPVIAPTTSSIVTSSRRRLATRSPRRRTSMRSATSKTSGMLWLISTTDTPRPRTRPMRSSTWRVWTTPSAAVGSSMKTTLLAHVTARLTATPWRWPPDILATGAVESCRPTPRLLNASSERRCISALSRKPSRPSSPPRRISRPRNRFAAGSSSAASARSW